MSERKTKLFQAWIQDSLDERIEQTRKELGLNRAETARVALALGLKFLSQQMQIGGANADQ